MKRDAVIKYLKDNFKASESISIATTFCCKDAEWLLVNHRDTHFKGYKKKLTLKQKTDIIELFNKSFDASIGASWDSLLWTMVEYLDTVTTKNEKVINLKNNKE